MEPTIGGLNNESFSPTVCLCIYMCVCELIVSLDRCTASQLPVINPILPSISCTRWCNMWSTSMTWWSSERIKSSQMTLSTWRPGWRAASHSTQDALGKWNKTLTAAFVVMFCRGAISCSKSALTYFFFFSGGTLMVLICTSAKYLTKLMWMAAAPVT